MDSQPSGKKKRGVQTSLDITVLQGLLPSNYKLVVNEKARIITLLSIDTAEVIGQEQFSPNEWSILDTLLESRSHYAPYEILLACLTSLSPDECRKSIQQAQESGSKALKRELKPVYNAIFAIRTKLARLTPHLNVSTVPHLGYSLITSKDEEFDNRTS